MVPDQIWYLISVTMSLALGRIEGFDRSLADRNAPQELWTVRCVRNYETGRTEWTCTTTTTQERGQQDVWYTFTWKFVLLLLCLCFSLVPRIFVVLTFAVILCNM